MNWKDKLELEYESEKDFSRQCTILTLFCYWRGHLLIRKQIIVKTEHFNFNHHKRMLRKWFDDYVLNYEDLTTRQKRRIENVPFVGEAPTLIGKRYDRLYSYVDSEFVKYAKIKIILVRVNYVRGETNNYQVRPKNVICELL